MNNETARNQPKPDLATLVARVNEMAAALAACTGAESVRVTHERRNEDGTLTVIADSAAPTYKVKNISAAKWEVREGSELVGHLVQGISQSWYAYDAEGKTLNIKAHKEYGGSEHPFTIANEFVTWKA